MRVTLIFESMFGNTETVARAVAAGMRDAGADVAVVRVGDPDEQAWRGADLLVVGAPTHALSLSNPATRADAVTQGADPDVAGTGVREWLAAVPVVAPDGTERAWPPVAVFDTRARITRHWPGSAARRTARTLRKQGVTVTATASFYVDAVPGPLLPGEVERARDWGRVVVSTPLPRVGRGV